LRVQRQMPAPINCIRAFGMDGIDARSLMQEVERMRLR